MVRKAKSTKKSEKQTAAQQINTLQVCIAECENKLTISYEKTITQAEKEINQQQTKLTKAKEKLRDVKAKEKQAAVQYKAKKGKTTAARLEKAKASTLMAKEAIEAIQLTIQPLKQTLNELLQARKKFIAKQKLVLKFDNAWQKASVAAKKTPKKQSNKAIRKKSKGINKHQEETQATMKQSSTGTMEAVESVAQI